MRHGTHERGFSSVGVLVLSVVFAALLGQYAQRWSQALSRTRLFSQSHRTAGAAESQTLHSLPAAAALPILSALASVSSDNGPRLLLIGKRRLSGRTLPSWKHAALFAALPGGLFSGASVTRRSLTLNGSESVVVVHGTLELEELRLRLASGGKTELIVLDHVRIGSVVSDTPTSLRVFSLLGRIELGLPAGSEWCDQAAPAATGHPSLHLHADSRGGIYVAGRKLDKSVYGCELPRDPLLWPPFTAAGRIPRP